MKETDQWLAQFRQIGDSNSRFSGHYLDFDFIIQILIGVDFLTA
jgi:hypothetical protein